MNDTTYTTRPSVLAERLSRVAGQVSRLEKTGHNPHFKYDFVTSDDVSEMLRPLLASEGIVFLPSMEDYEQKDGGKTKTTLVRFKFTFIAAETGESFSANWYGEAAGNDDKGFNKAATAAVKYFLLKTFLVSTGEIADDPDYDYEPEPRQQQRPQNFQNPQSHDRRVNTSDRWNTGKGLADFAKRIQSELQLKLSDAVALLKPLTWDDFSTPQDAFEAIVAAMKPPTPKAGQGWNDDTFARFDDLCNTYLGLSADDLAGEMNIDQWEKAYKTPQDAVRAIAAHTQKHQHPVIATSVEYVDAGKQKYLRFKTPFIEVRAYGRSTTFKEWVGDEWYDANGAADWQPGTIYEITPVRLDWEAKGSGDNVYYAATDALPVGGSDMWEPGEEDALLDQVQF